MQKLNNTIHQKRDLPIKVLQFGEGNFLRAFVDWMIQKANNELNLNMGVAIIQPLANGMVAKLKEQDCLYHVILEGIKDGKPVREIELIDCVMDAVNPYSEYKQYKQYFLNPELEFIISNTTEAGISRIENENIFAEPPVSFPGKIVGLLYERFKLYQGDPEKGLTFICCELIENNATILKEIVLELAVQNNLEANFTHWIESSCSFCNSLVDRIVTGFPKNTIAEIQKQLGYADNMVVTAEYYHLWAIEGNAAVQSKFSLDKAGLHVVWLDDLKAFRDKKVRVLNGSHTALVPIGLLIGHQTVKEAFMDEQIATFIREMIANEVLPSIEGNKAELTQFASEILERFFNPYINHFLKDISLNSISKWTTRNYPSLLDGFQQTGIVPQRLAFSLSALLVLYSPENNIDFKANDTQTHLDFISATWNSNLSLSDKVFQILSNKQIWGISLTEINGLSQIVTANIESITKNGISSALQLIK